MNHLSNTVFRYYLKHLDELSLYQQFHFASRLYLWDRDDVMRHKLTELRSTFTANEQPAVAISEVITATRQAPTLGSKNATELRKPYFEKYPNLKTYVAVLFRINFLRSIYQLDAASTFYDHFPSNQVESFAQYLLDDPMAVAMLSTHAINFFYLYSRLVSKNPDLFDPANFLRVGARQYDHNNPLHLQLLIYLYTHCIIGESQFYYRAISEQPVYQQMFGDMEALIAQHFNLINLDNKFEFLVCGRLLGRQTVLRDRIYDEANHSISSAGSFLVDRHNTNPQTANSDLATSEHRNVLFIMSTRSYRPLTGSA